MSFYSTIVLVLKNHNLSQTVVFPFLCFIGSLCIEQISQFEPNSRFFHFSVFWDPFVLNKYHNLSQTVVFPFSVLWNPFVLNKYHNLSLTFVFPFLSFMESLCIEQISQFESNHVSFNFIVLWFLLRGPVSSKKFLPLSKEEKLLLIIK